MVFETQVDTSFAFLIANFQFRRSPSKRIGRSVVIAFKRNGLTVECAYEFGESIAIGIVYAPLSGATVGCTIHEAMAAQCPEENGWPYAKHLPDSWPKVVESPKSRCHCTATCKLRENTQSTSQRRPYYAVPTPGNSYTALRERGDSNQTAMSTVCAIIAAVIARQGGTDV